MTYVDPQSLEASGKTARDTWSLPTRDIVRVNCKFDPKTTHIRFPPHMANFKKSCMVRSKDTKAWQIAEEMGSMDYVTSFKEDTFDRCAIFALSPRITASDTCYYCPGPDLDDCKITTMNSSGRKHTLMGSRVLIHKTIFPRLA